jgi:nucleotide-binding universal stress UspA family protein/predicted transcriptional regulator
MRQTLIVPLDGSPFAERALPYATSLARRFDARIIILHAQSNEVLPNDSAPDLDAVANRLRAAGVEVGVRVCHLPDAQETGEILLAAAEDLGGTILVMATHGRGRIGRMIYGSVVDQILSRATMAVLLVSPTSEHLLPSDGPFRILVPLDGSAFAEEILPLLQNLARSVDVELLVLRVAETIELRIHGDECVRCRLARDRGEEPDLEYVRAGKYIGEVADRLRRSGLIVASKMIVGSATAEISRLACERHVDLIAMATHGRTGLARLVMGSVAMATLQQSHVPVLMIRPEIVREEGRLAEPTVRATSVRPTVGGGLSVKDIMTAPVVSVSADMGLHDVAQRMLEHGIGGVPVVDDSGNLLGIITESDFVGKEGYVPFTPFRMPQLFGQWMPQQDVEAIYRTARTMKARDIMSTPVFSTVEDEPVSELAQRMVERNITRMPVVRGTTLVGMVSRHDLLRLLLDDHLGSTPGDVDNSRLTRSTRSVR